MKRRVTWIAASLLALCLLAVAACLRKLDQVRERATLEEVMFISSPAALKKMSLGYEGLLADLYWTRVVQYYGERHVAGEGTYKLLLPLLQITTTLDPRLIVAYEYGSNFLTANPPQGAGMPREAAELVQAGIRQNPDEWHLYYDLGFVYYLDLKDYPKAAKAFAAGAGKPNAHPWMKVLAAGAAQKGGADDMARMLWSATYQTTADKDIKLNAESHLRALQVDHDVETLQPVIEKYRDTFGRYPTSFEEVAKAGMIPGIPVDPLKHPYQINSKGDMEVRFPDDLPFINKGLPPAYVRVKPLKDVITAASN